MACPNCGADQILFVIPADLRSIADSDAAAICPHCLAVDPLEDSAEIGADADFSAIEASFPDGEPGVAIALILVRLDSLALHRQSVVELFDYAEANGADVFLTLDRLIESDSVEPWFDLARRRSQLDAWVQ
ncbi:DUF6276 family protein [Halalkalirubrum salinum]|uniref:DUF6276 family protein n=1 Tax=Halalkalirubrum salinum TaxID=2563889 RepID=UPI00197A99B1|nr:DUF6276 family protein [Halalkalirubrum salinum]